MFTFIFIFICNFWNNKNKEKHINRTPPLSKQTLGLQRVGFGPSPSGSGCRTFFFWRIHESRYLFNTRIRIQIRQIFYGSESDWLKYRTRICQNKFKSTNRSGPEFIVISSHILPWTTSPLPLAANQNDSTLATHPQIHPTAPS